ncbi:MAG: lactate utilization protein C [Proteobacteria bacterium]|nr:lactate utilization protein C [Pseudomonadota bacterium]
MSDARIAILEQVARAVGRKNPVTQISKNQGKQVAPKPQHTRPKWPEPDVERFVQKLENVQATVETVTSDTEIPAAVQRFLGNHNLPAKISISPDPRLAGLIWPDLVRVTNWQPRHEAVVGIAPAEAGVVETGSVLLVSGQTGPTSLNFLSENHIAIIHREQLVAHMEDVWELLRLRHEDLPRTVNFITGPSKTADIEQTIEYGAHGPKRFHVILVDGKKN